MLQKIVAIYLEAVIEPDDEWQRDRLQNALLAERMLHLLPFYYLQNSLANAAQKNAHSSKQQRVHKEDYWGRNLLPQSRKTVT